MSKKVITIIFSIFIISGCSNSTEPESIHPLVGVWEMSQIKMITDSGEVTINSNEDFNSTMVFNEDETFSYTNESDGETMTGNGTWSTNGGILTTIEDDGTTLVDYSLNGDTFIVIEDGEDNMIMEITYIRQ